MSLEKRIIETFKSLLYQSMIESREKYSTSDYAFEFALSGTGALEFVSVNKKLVNTVDADMHFWNVAGLPFNQALRLSSKEIFEDIVRRLTKTIQNYFMEQISYFMNLIKVEDPKHYNEKIRNIKNYRPIYSRGGIGKTSFVGTIRILSYDLADIVMEKGHNCSEFFVIPAGFKTNVKSQDYYMNILTPNWFLLNHLEMLSFQYGVPLIGKIRSKAIWNFYENVNSLPEDDPIRNDIFTKQVNLNNRSISDVVGTMIYTESEKLKVRVIKSHASNDQKLLNQWGLFIVLNLLFFNRDRLGLKDYALERDYSTEIIDEYSDKFKEYMVKRYYYYPFQGTDEEGNCIQDNKGECLFKNPGDKKHYYRTLKTIKRLYILFYLMTWYFTMENGIVGIALKFISGRTSCAVQNIRRGKLERVNMNPVQRQECVNKIVMGFGVKTGLTEFTYNQRIQQLNRDLTAASLNVYNTIGSPSVFPEYYGGICYPQPNNYLKYTESKLRAMNPRDAVCLWSAQSGDLTNKMIEYQLRTLFGLKDNGWINKNQKTIIMIQKLEQAARTRINEDLEVYKTSRHVIYENGDTSYDMKLGQKYPLSIFNSTTIKRNYNNLLSFASFETGSSSYTIIIPKNTPFCYMGYNKNRSLYPDEYEVLLPPGGYFEVIEDDDDSYLGYKMDFEVGPKDCIISKDTQLIFGLKHYKILYIPPVKPYSQLMQQGKNLSGLFTGTSTTSMAVLPNPTTPEKITPAKKKSKIIKPTPVMFWKKDKIPKNQELILDGNLGNWLPKAIKKYLPDVIKEWKKLPFKRLYKDVVRFIYKFANGVISFIPWSVSLWTDRLKPAFEYVFDQAGIVFRFVKRIFISTITSIMSATALINMNIRERLSEYMNTLLPLVENIEVIIYDQRTREEFIIEIDKNADLYQLKEAIFDVTGIPIDKQILTYNDKFLNKEGFLYEKGIDEGAMINLIH